MQCNTHDTALNNSSRKTTHFSYHSSWNAMKHTPYHTYQHTHGTQHTSVTTLHATKLGHPSARRSGSWPSLACNVHTSHSTFSQHKTHCSKHQINTVHKIQHTKINISCNTLQISVYTQVTLIINIHFTVFSQHCKTLINTYDQINKWNIKHILSQHNTVKQYLTKHCTARHYTEQQNMI